ncbi:sensor histidine kinase [Caulobacter sp. KR2-114]|uniref:sensor histidine kinase n=1 Tax=Caulobacter sp. KR2-114 TaxID=3400912 RepID=UPI003C04166B
MDWFSSVFSTAGFLPHGYCILWRPDILTLHVVSDLVIAIAYFSIPGAILAFARSRADLTAEEKRIALLFGLFITACGVTHLMSIVVLWRPLYVLDGLAKAVTALASIATAIAVWPLLPRLMRIPSPSALAEANRRLEEEASARRAALEALGAARDSLEAQVEARTREARELSSRLTAVLDTVPDAMIVIDERGAIQSASAIAERVFGYTRAEMVGRNVSMLMPEPYHGEHDGYLAHYLASGERRIIGIGRVVMGRRADGGVFPMELAVGELKLDGARQFTGFVRDITERQESERRLQELQSELLHVSRLNEMGQMASAFAHELNQPLSAASNYLSGAIRLLHNGQTARAAEGCARAVEQIGRTGEVIRRLRTFVGRGDATRQVEDLAKLVEEGSALALVGARADGVKASMRLSDEAPSAVVDKVQVQQVVVNLVRNAVEAMAPSVRRELTISTAAGEAGFVEIAVADTGPGLAPDIRAKLFQPFNSSKATGMGVGLSLCRSIVESHGGHIWAEDGAGGGTIFRFTLPAT